MQNLTRALKTVQKIFIPSPLVPMPGSQVRAPIAGKEVPSLDPFVALYYFNIKAPFGFPDHPHLGMETITYILDGEYNYEDFKGHEGVMRAGHLQWMTAGKGLVHAERPASNEKAAFGLQFWMNLPKKEKFCDPEYQEFTGEKVPVTTKDGVKVKVLAGETLGVKAPVHQRNPTLLLDIELPANSKFEQAIPKGWNAFCIVHEGKALFGENKEEGDTHATVVLNKDDNEVLLIETKEEGAKVFLAAAQPVNESVVRFDAVVLCTQEELEKAKDDWKSQKEGFSHAQGWESGIKKFLVENRPQPGAQSQPQQH